MEYRRIYQGHALEVMRAWPDNVIDCVITSPPYWGLRAYGTEPVIWDGEPDCDHKWGEEIKVGQTTAQTKYQAADKAFKQVSSRFCLKCGAWLGELGGEPSKYLFIKHLCDIFDEVRRVLKPTGVCFININDTYIDKSLAQIPFHFSLEMCERGWYHRNTIIWHKPNALPQSVRDRFTVDYEYVFFFAAEKSYYFKQSEIIEPYSERSDPYEEYDGQATKDYRSAMAQDPSETKRRILDGMAERGGRNKRCVWSITTKPFSEAHFAVFPPNLLEPMIKAGCPPDGVVFDPFIGCYDDKTEVLTREGWKFFKNVTFNDEFVTMTETRQLEYHKPIQIFKYKYSGEMIKIKSRSADLLVTPNHNMFVRSHADYQADRNPRLIQAQDLALSLYRIPIRCNYTYENSDLSKEFMYLIGLYVSEGFFQKEKGKITNNLIICQNPGEKWDEMVRNIENKYKVFKRSWRKFRVKLTDEERDFILENCSQGKYNKFLSPYILSQKHLRSLFEGMIIGDGSNRDGQYLYWTTSEKLKDSFQELCLKLGYGSTYSSRIRTSNIKGREIKAAHRCYSITVRKSKDQKLLNKHISKKDYNGFVYCVEVPNHTLYVRRNGRTVWCGNSGTVGVVAEKFNRKWLGAELNAEFIELAEKRIKKEATQGYLEGIFDD